MRATRHRYHRAEADEGRRSEQHYPDVDPVVGGRVQFSQVHQIIWVEHAAQTLTCCQDFPAPQANLSPKVWMSTLSGVLLRSTSPPSSSFGQIGATNPQLSGHLRITLGKSARFLTFAPGRFDRGHRRCV